jgi:hypothetical protein
MAARCCQLRLLGSLLLSLCPCNKLTCDHTLPPQTRPTSYPAAARPSPLHTRISFIVLPIAGNACEHITAVFVAMKNKMDLRWGAQGTWSHAAAVARLASRACDACVRDPSSWLARA